MKAIKTLFAALLTATATLATAADLALLFAGDIMLDDGPGRALAAGRDPLAAFASILAGRLPHRQSRMPGGHHRCAACQQDLQFPCPPQGAGCGQGRFDAGPVQQPLRRLRQEAFVDTMRHLEAAGIRYFGGGRNLAEAHAPLWIARKGLRIAVLGYNEFKPRPSRPAPAARALPGARTARCCPTSAPPARPAPTW
jgi:poly-gamma-glutamate synthesis protein (capsule biosynthesis protein)